MIPFRYIIYGNVILWIVLAICNMWAESPPGTFYSGGSDRSYGEVIDSINRCNNGGVCP